MLFLAADLQQPLPSFPHSLLQNIHEWSRMHPDQQASSAKTGTEPNTPKARRPKSQVTPKRRNAFSNLISPPRLKIFYHLFPIVGATKMSLACLQSTRIADASGVRTSWAAFDHSPGTLNAEESVSRASASGDAGFLRKSSFRE